MRKILLNGCKMDTREHTHCYLKRQLRLPDYYGANLDALWDLLSTYGMPVRITLINRAALIRSLGDYGSQLIQVLQQAERANSHLRFRVM